MTTNLRGAISTYFNKWVRLVILHFLLKKRDCDHRLVLMLSGLLFAVGGTAVGGDF